MIGDIIAALSNLSCRHSYVPKRTPHGAFGFKECARCGRLKDFVRL